MVSHLIQDEIVLSMGVADKLAQMLFFRPDICHVNQVNANLTLVRVQNSSSWVEDLVNCVLNRLHFCL